MCGRCINFVLILYTFRKASHSNTHPSHTPQQPQTTQDEGDLKLRIDKDRKNHMPLAKGINLRARGCVTVVSIQ